MVYDGVHNPAVRLSDTGADCYRCADPYASAVSPAYPRADADTNTYADHNTDTYAGVYGYTYADGYPYSYAHTGASPHFGTNGYALAYTQCAVSHHNDYGF